MTYRAPGPRTVEQPGDSPAGQDVDLDHPSLKHLQELVPLGADVHGGGPGRMSPAPSARRR